MKRYLISLLATIALPTAVIAKDKIFDNFVQITCDVYSRDKSQTERQVLDYTFTELKKKMDLNDLELTKFIKTFEDLDDPNNRIYEAIAKWVDCGFQKMEDYGIVTDKKGELILNPNLKIE